MKGGGSGHPLDRACARGGVWGAFDGGRDAEGTSTGPFHNPALDVPCPAPHARAASPLSLRFVASLQGLVAMVAGCEVRVPVYVSCRGF